MAQILEFRVTTGKVPATAHARPIRRQAEIVIFPGVRYERWDDGKGVGKSPAVARDTLKLVE
jgi:hypothetical protein